MFGKLYGIADPRPQVQRGWSGSRSPSSPRRWATSCRRGSARSSASSRPRCTGRRCSCSTSRRRRSIPTSRSGSASGSSGSAPTTAPRCWSRATTWSRSSGCASGSCSSRTAGSSPTVRRPTSPPASVATTSRACSCTSRPSETRRRRAARAGVMSWIRIKAIARRHAYVLQRAPQRWFDVVVWPVVDAILFGAIGVYFGRQQGGSGAEAGAAFLLAGIVLFHVVFQAEVSLATGFMEETWSRNLLNLMVTPLREVEYARGGRAVRPREARDRSGHRRARRARPLRVRRHEPRLRADPVRRARCCSSAGPSASS